MAVPAAPPKSSTPKPSSHSRTTSQASSRNYAASAPVSRRGPRSTAPDYLSDKATAAFIRRTLCPQQNGDAGRNAAAPIEELLPPLTSRNDVDLQLYAFLAVILKEFVQAWYSKITPDETFVAEIVQIIAHCTRAVEQRLRKVDLESLLLDEIPDLLDRHITARRAARNPIARPPIEVHPREVYHSLCPLPYLSPVPTPDSPEAVELQRENERAYRQLLVRAVLAILLPTEDLENPCLTSLVGEILSETIIGNVIANKASQPWLIWEGLAILARNITEGKRRRPKRRDNDQPSSASAGRGFSAQGLLSSVIHWMFLAFVSIQFLVTTLVTASSFPRRGGRSFSENGDLTSQSSPDYTSTPDASSLEKGDPVTSAKVPLVDFRIWPCIANLIELQSRMPWLAGTLSMLQLGLLDGPGRIGDVDRTMDSETGSHAPSFHVSTLVSTMAIKVSTNLGAKSPYSSPIAFLVLGSEFDPQPPNAAVSAFTRPAVRTGLTPNAPSLNPSTTAPEAHRPTTLSHLLHQHVFDPSRLPPLLRSLRAALFPNNAPGTPTLFPPTSDEQLLALRRRSAASLASIFPPWLTSLYFAGRPPWTSAATRPASSNGVDSEVVDAIDDSLLDVFADEYCNKHLMYSVLELVLVRLMPELTEKRVSELWEERLN
ncbi:hypothetical protein SAPIO_CDS5851 [Scedosporium apiospermum]|uniref:PXA domain-containing protein n=1 Tax=Pseudallescheria apiosperma TaxID=563466 RepID=A0A084G5J8_PSEDA|nr:uncharacterized protein SAPIO_CDS5851 [Scedosporium apiospermum]KEZ42610.1 hypothetical protein SAPIO_CDS5851 [Scedosporium apiospermum]